MDDVTAAGILINSLDLTSLNENDTPDTVKDLCFRAVTPYGKTAAVCIYPKFIPLVLQNLPDNIRIATVVNFPAGGEDMTATAKEIKRALKSGADEIDAVFPYRAWLAGKTTFCREFLNMLRDETGDNTLKVIIESGELGSTTRIREVSEMCIEAKADFIKTSTGKTKISATPEAANAILETIRDSKADVGFKASGGIKTTEQAKKYLTLAQSVMGPGWINRAHFRIGASSVLNNLLETIKQGY